MATYFQAIKLAKTSIHHHNLDPYVAVYLIQRRFHMNNTQLLMNYSVQMPANRFHQYKDDVKTYLKGESPQYIIGTTSFYGYNLYVNHNVLIPRPETEGLVDWILHDYQDRPISVVDIGTGSGAIAVALKLQRPKWHVTATDISQTALNVAKKNAKLHDVKINFKHCDLFQGLPRHAFDVIVSNPPYISKTELPEMGADVIRNEPHVALFANHHGMGIYQRIAKDFRQYLKTSGSLYLEIGFSEKKRIEQLFKQVCPDDLVTIKNDLSDHPRMVKVHHKL